MSSLTLFKPSGKFFIMGFLLFSVCANAQQVKFGVATWLDNSEAGNMHNFYALHKHVSIGTTIQVRNPMNNRSINVVVIGKLPSSEANKNIIISLSGAAARYLDMLDAKVRVELSIPQRSREALAAIQ